ncbi:hypothetical protein [Paracoccus sp. IB05]|uniref:hypothetical protein n=1 Tax=Paracoccus sp. IB05 TaxID=2779367 RepID=UPI0018E7DB4B|nr:hypothetical protein [Paracoccus sp. IB05]MBJ2150312.1 hypothetical protein [Paracoccus sp. IB05]
MPREVLTLLRELQQREQVAFLLITHDPGILRGMADDVAVLKDGCLVEYGATEQVPSHPQHPYTRALIAAGHFSAASTRNTASSGS